MNISQVFEELTKKWPSRTPSSPGTDAVLTEIKAQTATWDYQPTIERISTYRYRVSVALYIVISFLAISLSFSNPFWGLIMAVLFWVLLLIEPLSPTLAKLKPFKAEKATITIPARSKETQKIVLVANYGTDNFVTGFGKLSSLQYIMIIVGLGLLQIILLGMSQFSHLPWLLPYLYIFPLAIFWITFFIKKRSQVFNSLSGCATLLEIGAILSKARPNTAKVVLNFYGTNSLHSGISNIAKLLKANQEIDYVVHLLDWPDKRINIISSDGITFPLKTDPVLVDLLMEVAKEKSIPIQAIQSKVISNTYLLKLKKVKAVTVTNPYETAESGKSIRELLIGLIRKMDH